MRTGQAGRGCRSGRQLVQGAKPAAAAPSRVPNSVSVDSGRDGSEPQVGTQYSLSPVTIVYIAPRSTLKSFRTATVFTPSTASSRCLSSTRRPA